MEKSVIKSFLPLLCLAASTVCIYLYITHYPPTPPVNYALQDRLALDELLPVVEFGYPLVGAFLIVLLITNPFTLRKSIRNLRRLKSGSSGQPPRDGSAIAVAGQIFADHKPTATPAGHTSCIAYYYVVKPRYVSKNISYFGYAFTPSSIDASFGKVKILAFPHIDIFSKPETTYDDSGALYNFKTYLRNTSLVKSLIGYLPFSKGLNVSMADRKSPVTIDVKMGLGSPDPDRGIIIERCLNEREMVCAFGTYSASQKGLVHDPDAGDSSSIQIKIGPISKFIQEEKVSIARNLFGLACALVLLPAMVWAYQNYYFTLDTMTKLVGIGG